MEVRIMPLPRKASVRFRIAAAVLALMLLTGCGQGSTDKVKTVVVENDRLSSAAADISGDWYGWWRMYGTSGDWAQMDGCWWDCCTSTVRSSS